MRKYPENGIEPELFSCCVCGVDEEDDSLLDVCEKCGKLFHPRSCGDSEDREELCWNCFEENAGR